MILCIALGALFKDSHSLTSFITEETDQGLKLEWVSPRVFFAAMTDGYKWKGKGCLSHLLSAPLGMVLLVDIFPQRETHTDRLD